MSSTTKPPRRTRVATTIAQLLLVLMLLSSGFVLFLDVYQSVKGPGVKVDVQLSWQQMDTVPGPAIPPGAEYGNDAGVRKLTTPPLPLGTRLFASAGTILYGLAVIVGLVYLAQLLGAIERGEPFAARNARRLSAIGACVLAGGVAAPWLTRWGKREALAAIGMDRDLFSEVAVSDVYSSDHSSMGLLIGLIVLAVAHVVRRGRQLSEDSEGLV